MSWRIGLYAHLTGHAQTSALVGFRVYPGRLNKAKSDHDPGVPSELPAITYFRVSTPRHLVNAGPIRYQAPRVQLNCFGRTPDEAEAVGDAAIAALQGLKGTMGGVEVLLVENVGDVDDFEQQAEYYRRILDFVIHHNVQEVA
jgi:hypothetical protein